MLVCLYTDEQVRDVCLGTELLAGMTGGSVLVVHTTCSPRTIEAVAERAAPHGIRVVDAAVSGGPHDIAAGQRVKLVNNALFAAQIGLLADAARLGRELGVDEAVLLGALSHGSAASRALAGAVPRGSVALFAAAVSDFLGKDVAVVRTVAAELGADLGAVGDMIKGIEAG